MSECGDEEDEGGGEQSEVEWKVWPLSLSRGGSRHWILGHQVTFAGPTTSLHQGEPAFSSSSSQQYLASTSAPATSSQPYSQHQSVAKPGDEWLLAAPS